jgi:hypothetical protein
VGGVKISTSEYLLQCGIQRGEEVIIEVES